MKNSSFSTISPKKIIVILSIIVCIAVGWRYIRTMRTGGGRTVLSPNQKYYASAMAFRDKNFWGTPTAWYEFEIGNTSTHKALVYRKINVSENQTLYGFRSGGLGSIEWDPNSTYVIFKGGENEISTLNISGKKQ
jgi:hypothetical protein